MNLKSGGVIKCLVRAYLAQTTEYFFSFSYSCYSLAAAIRTTQVAAINIKIGGKKHVKHFR